MLRRLSAFRLRVLDRTIGARYRVLVGPNIRDADWLHRERWKPDGGALPFLLCTDFFFFGSRRGGIDV